LTHVQEGLADIWKENILEGLEVGKIKFVIARKFLVKLKKKFEGRIISQQR